jgi:hypothetical protein
LEGLTKDEPLSFSLLFLIILFSEEENWPDITSENRIKHEILFYSQGPVDGFIIGKFVRVIITLKKYCIINFKSIYNSHRL